MVSILDHVTLILILVLMGVFSIYKLVGIYRHRNDPAKRGRFINNTEVYPPKISKWMVDARYNEKHGIGRAPNQGRK